MDLPPLAIPLAILAIVLLLVALSVSLTPRVPAGTGVNRGTRFFLVLLRLAIGWHFLFEGVEKFNTPGWSSEPYLREATGPLAPYFHELAGDRLKDELTVGPGGSFPPRLADEWQAYFDRFVARYELNDKQRAEAEARFQQAEDRTLRFLTQEQRPVKVTAKMPPPLEVMLTVPQRIKLYEEKLAEARKAEAYEVPLYRTAGWARVRDFKAEANSIRAGLKKDLADQTKAMMDSLAQVVRPAPLLEGEKDYDSGDPLLSADVIGLMGSAFGQGPLLTGFFLAPGKTHELLAAQGKARLRARMKTEWDAYFEWFVDHYTVVGRERDEARQKFRAAWERALKVLADPKATVADMRDQGRDMMRDLDGLLPPGTADAPPPAAVASLPFGYTRDWSRLDWADFLVKWGLLFVGIFLIAGLLTRTTCVVAALFLLSFFLAMPPLPGLPESPRAEGHYLYINKNVIEMLALLALATTRSGRWAGLDGLLQLFRPRAWQVPPPERGPAAEPPLVSSARTDAEPARAGGERGGPSPGPHPSSEEITHGS